MARPDETQTTDVPPTKARTFEERKLAAAKALLAEVDSAGDFPWYDSGWLGVYRRALRFLQDKHPGIAHELESLVEPLQTSPSFQVCHLPSFVDTDQLQALRAEVARVVEAPISTYERENFGRDLLHDRPAFTEFQAALVDPVSELVGEPVVPCYNFLSLYGSEGVCAPHLDSPKAKWTVDICIDQSVSWPLQVSPVVPWPLEWDATTTMGWQDQIKGSSSFTSYVLEPGDAVIFGGSSQWHYRDPMPASRSTDYCHLLFLHYVPANSEAEVEPGNWPELLDVPALRAICNRYYASSQTRMGLHTTLTD